MDTVIDTATHVQLGQDGQPDGQSRTEEYLPIVDAARAIGRSEKTVRRLVGRGLLPKIEEKAPPFRKLVDMSALRQLVADDSLDAVGRLSTQDVGRQSTQPVGQVANQPGQGREERPRDDQDRLYAEIERLHSELKETRAQSRAEIEAKEKRLQDLTDQLIVAKQDAGKWQQAEAYRQQLYQDFMRLQDENARYKVRLELLEHNPPRSPAADLPPEREVIGTGGAVIEVDPAPVAAPPTPDGPKRSGVWIWPSAAFVMAVIILVWARMMGLI